jgi:hypothetical protein
MGCAIGNTNIIHGKRPIFNGFTKIKCDRVGSSIFDFTLGKTTTNTNADILNLSDLLIGYSATSQLPPKPCSVVFLAVVLSVLA